MPHFLSQLLYWARWMGALLVLAVHASSIFINYGGTERTEQPLALAGWRFAVSFEFGHQAVVGFFVMSGFLVGGTALAHLREEKPFLLDYIIHRVARIYLVLIPALLLTIVADSAGRALFASSGVYDVPLLRDHYDPLLILTNLLNLQSILAPHYGTNGPLWSVAYEFWYYVLFPLLLIPFSRRYPPAARKTAAAVAFGASVAATLSQSWFLLGFVLWGLGAAAASLDRPLIRSKFVAILIFAGVTLSSRLIVCGESLMQHPALLHMSDFVSASAFANLILTLRFAPGAAWPFLASRIHKRLADFSFTVYSIHCPLLMFARAGATHYLGPDWLAEPAAPVQWLALAAAMALVLIFAFLLSRVTEAKTGLMRRKLRRLAARLHELVIACPALTPAVLSREMKQDAGAPAQYDR
jgi:peptidoglycan/LPS O-acetylase OafA/YrhL